MDWSAGLGFWCRNDLDGGRIRALLNLCDPDVAQHIFREGDLHAGGSLLGGNEAQSGRAQLSAKRVSNRIGLSLGQGRAVNELESYGARAGNGRNLLRQLAFRRAPIASPSRSI